MPIKHEGKQVCEKSFEWVNFEIIREKYAKQLYQVHDIPKNRSLIHFLILNR